MAHRRGARTPQEDWPLIPTCEPHITPEDIRAVVDALSAGHAATGPEVQAFEEAVGGVLQQPHAVATSSGTTALHVALKALGIGPGDKVVVPTLTFIASAAAVVHCGAEPVFVDSERDTWGMDPTLLWDALAGVKAVIATHLYGHPCKIDRLKAVCDYWNVPLIEDAAEALGASPIGLGDITCLSFNHNKIITTGGGGMALTRDADLAAMMRLLVAQARADTVEWKHVGIGFNYRMGAMQAALGLSQLGRLADCVNSKLDTWGHYLGNAYATLESRKANGSTVTEWLAAFLLDRDALPVIEALNAQGIGARPVWFPLHRQPMWEQGQACPVADDLHRRGIILPCSVTITPEERAQVVQALQTVLAAGTSVPAPSS